MTTKCAFAFVVLLFVTAAYAEVVSFRECPTEPNEFINCTVHEVRVNPCKDSENGKPCKLKRGTDAGISFDYTPDFNGDKLEGRAYWANQVVDLPFLGMEVDACKVTTCPAVAGQRQSYSIQLPIAKAYPARQYDVKWKLWNEQGDQCCFIIQIKITK